MTNGHQYGSDNKETKGNNTNGLEIEKGEKDDSLIEQNKEDLNLPFTNEGIEKAQEIAKNDKIEAIIDIQNETDNGNKENNDKIAYVTRGNDNTNGN